MGGYVGFIVGLAIVVVFYNIINTKKRRADLKALARSLNASRTVSADQIRSVLEDGFQLFALFKA